MIKEMGNLVKPINPCGNQVRLKEYPKCKALGLRSIPMIGQYGEIYIYIYIFSNLCFRQQLQVYVSCEYYENY